MAINYLVTIERKGIRTDQFDAIVRGGFERYLRRMEATEQYRECDNSPVYALRNGIVLHYQSTERGLRIVASGDKQTLDEAVLSLGRYRGCVVDARPC